MGRQPLPRPYPPEPPGSEDRYKLKLRRAPRASIHYETTDHGPVDPGTEEPAHKTAHIAAKIGRGVAAIWLLLVAGLFTLFGLLILASERCVEWLMMGSDYGTTECEIGSDWWVWPSVILATAALVFYVGLRIALPTRIANYVLGSLVLLITLASGGALFVLAVVLVAVGLSKASRRKAELRRAANPAYPPGSEGRDGWFPDPAGRFEKRYHDGQHWTDHVANISEKLQTRDPIPVDPKTGKTPSDH